MDTLSMTEAQLFTKLCTYVWACNIEAVPAVLILPKEASPIWIPNLYEQTIISDSGLTVRQVGDIS